MFYISCTPVTFNNTALNSNRISSNSLNRIMCECYIFSMWMWWADCCLCHFHHNQFLMPSIQLPEITNPSTFLEPHVPCSMPHATWPHGARCGNMICLLHRVAFGIGAEESHAPVSECSEKPLTQTGQVASDGFLHVGCGLKRLPDWKSKIGLNRCSSELNYGW